MRWLPTQRPPSGADSRRGVPDSAEIRGDSIVLITSALCQERTLLASVCVNQRGEGHVERQKGAFHPQE